MKVLDYIRCKMFKSHNWEFAYFWPPKVERKCTRCGKHQHNIYDMMYGTTIWKDGPYWSCIENEKFN